MRLDPINYLKNLTQNVFSNAHCKTLTHYMCFGGFEMSLRYFNLCRLWFRLSRGIKSVILQLDICLCCKSSITNCISCSTFRNALLNISSVFITPESNCHVMLVDGLNNKQVESQFDFQAVHN